MMMNRLEIANYYDQVINEIDYITESYITESYIQKDQAREVLSLDLFGYPILELDTPRSVSRRVKPLCNSTIVSKLYDVILDSMYFKLKHTLIIC